MPFKPLVSAGIENVLNAFLYRAPALKAARQRLNGKVLRIVLKEFSTPLVLVFSERQLDVLGAWEGEADCSVITHMSVLPKLRDRQQSGGVRPGRAARAFYRRHCRRRHRENPSWWRLLCA